MRTISPPRMAGSTCALTETSEPTMLFQTRLQRRHLPVVERVGGNHLRAALATVPRGQHVEVAHDRGELAEAAVVRQHAQEVRGGRVEAHAGGGGADRARGVLAADQRARHQRLQIVRFGQRLPHGGEALAHLIELAPIARQFEQSGGVATAEACLYAAGLLHVASIP